MNGLVNLPVVALQVLALLALSAFWIWALVDCIRDAPPRNRIAWVVAIALTHALGALLYVVFGRRARADRGYERNL